MKNDTQLINDTNELENIGAIRTKARWYAIAEDFDSNESADEVRVEDEDGNRYTVNISKIIEVQEK